MRYRELGKTGIDVSVVAFGCWAIVGGFNWGEQDKEDSLAALRAAYDAGITLFDTAEGYGNGESEELIAEALFDVRDKIVIATKVSPGNYKTPEQLREHCEASLQRLQTDYIDLYQLHWPDHEVNFAETMAALEKLKDEGKIRAYGVSNFGKHELKDAVNFDIASNQLAYNLLFRAIEYDVLETCADNDISVLCYSPIMQGLLAGKFESPDDVPEDRARTRHFDSSKRPHTRHGEPGAEALTFETIDKIREIAEDVGESMVDVSLAWLLAQRGVTSVLVGGRNAHQARRNVTAAELDLSDETVKCLDEATRPLKEKLGPHPDMWVPKGGRIH